MVKTRVKLEKAIILSLVAVLFLTSIYSLTPPLPVIKEEAIEVSKTSELVREGLAIACSLTIETRYYNTSRLEELKK